VAAGHAILMAAGGSVVGRDGEALTYSTGGIADSGTLGLERSAAEMEGAR